jgi:stage II sporulation protein D
MRRLGRTGWLERVGPFPVLFAAFGLGAVLFVGCLNIGDSNWSSRKQFERQPDVIVDRQIRVLLGGSRPRPSERLSVNSPFIVSDARTGQELTRANPVSGVTIRPDGPRGVALGGTVFDRPEITLTPEQDAALVVGDDTYRGRLRISRAEGGVRLTNLVDVEGYLRGVLRGELPHSFHSESFKAQAVAARTYVLYEKKRATGRDFDVHDHEGSQMYIGVRGEDRIATDAVEQTFGQVCTWPSPDGDRIFCTYYSSTCGGQSQPVKNFRPNDPDVPPLRGNVVCPDCFISPHFEWKPVRITKAQLTARIVDRYPSVKKIGQIMELRPKGIGPDGRVIRIELIGSGGQAETLVGEDFRLCAGSNQLRSTRFTIETQPDAFVFKDGRGRGHGVGLCQFGMETKARKAMRFDEILAAYYPGSRITKLY